MQGRADEDLVKIAVERGFVSPQEVEACREAQQRIGRTGAYRSLFDILQDRGLLSAKQAAIVQRAAFAAGARSQIGPYRLEEKLGEGASGGVYRASHVRTGQTFAVKILRLRHADDPRYLRQFEKESEVIRQLDHPHIVRGHEGGWGAGYRYFVMEYVEGRTLQQIVRDTGPMPLKAALHAGACLASAIEYLAGRGVVHCDIKPSNIVVNAEGVIKLSDWGSARLCGLPVDLSRGDLVLATPAFMAPEFIRRGQPIDHRADLYSLGATLYFLLTARAPFQGESKKEIARKALSDRVVPPREINPEVGEDLDKVIRALLAKHAKNRPGDPALVRTLLRRMERKAAR